ncbi:MAG TPA: ROK family protein [Bacteroidota bacterium]|nr:ROK family protein [Bacteroidota bacterium]
MTHIRKSKRRQLISVNAKVGRDINRSSVLNSIREHQPISRINVAKMTGLNKSTVSDIVGELLEENLIEEDIDRNQKVGRNPINLRVKQEMHVVGAIYFNSPKTELAVIDIGGTIKSKSEIPTETENPKRFIEQCLTQLDMLREESKSPAFKGIGITVAGIVDSAQSKVIYAPNLGWENYEIGQIVRELKPDIELITIENDAKASALAELLLGRHETPPSSIVFLAVGNGIGSGIVINNHVLSGHSHAAGEFGHMTIVEGGELCSCGNQGCWEEYASDRATLRRYAHLKEISLGQFEKMSIVDVINAAKQGEALACEALSVTAQYMGLGIANIIRSFDPEVIIIGGLITQVWDFVYPKIMEIISKRGFFGTQQSTVVLPTSLTNSTALLGAASLSIRKIFADYRIEL